MLISTKDGWNYPETEPKWAVCPYWKFVDKCPLGQYWNELACQCFTMHLTCRMACPTGNELIPTEMCSCAPTEDIKTKIYPSWATDEDI